MMIFVYFQAERRRKLGLPPEEPAAPKPASPVAEKKVQLELNVLILHFII